jgi:hypothetical protein
MMDDQKILIERLTDASDFELDIGRSQLFELAASRITQLDKEIVELRKANAELESKLAGSKYTVDLFCVKYKELQRELAKRGMSQEEKNKTFHHDAKPGQGSFTMQQYKALKAGN